MKTIGDIDAKDTYKNSPYEVIGEKVEGATDGWTGGAGGAGAAGGRAGWVGGRMDGRTGTPTQ